MAAKSSRRLKLSKNLKPFISRVVTKGAVQDAFKAQTGSPVGQCVKSATAGKVGELSGAQIHSIAKNCARANAAKTLSGPFIHNGPSARVDRARRKAAMKTAA